MINPMRVDTSLLQGIAAVNQTAKTSSLKSTGTTASFSSALKSAEKETTKPVEGKHYAEILTGPRAGMYINTSGNARDGDAFVLVKTDKGEQHIYGTGKDRTVVSGAGDSESSSSKKTSSSNSTEGEKTKPVEGRAYADILNGPRSGLYLNTSGNARDGRAFALVMREGREFHVYGTGKDREIIGLRPKTETADEPKTATGTTPTGSLVTDNPS